MGNIKGDDYDPFPKTGLVKQYEPFIRQTVTEFCKMYPVVPRQEILVEAVRIAVEFEPKFKPESGNDFSTPLRHHLLGLHRFCQKRQLLAVNEIEQYPEWKPKDLIFGWPGVGKTTAVDVPYLLRLYGTADDLGLAERAAADMQIIINGPAPGISGRMRAVIDHHERRQREIAQEAENQKNGNYDSVFFDTRPFGPESKPATPLFVWEQRQLLQSAVYALRPSLNTVEVAVLRWMLRPAGRTQTQMAAEIGISKGYASKKVAELREKISLIIRNGPPE